MSASKYFHMIGQLLGLFGSSEPAGRDILQILTAPSTHETIQIKSSGVHQTLTVKEP